MSRSQTNRCGIRGSFTAVNGGPMKTIARALASSLLALAVSVLLMTDVHAAELRVLAGGSTTGWLNELARRFEQDTGHKLLIQFDSTPGAAKRDISTRGAVKRALLEEKSMAFLRESAAGAYVLKVFERLGVAEVMKAKSKPQTATGQIAQAVAGGDAELGMFLTNVLIAPGVELAGPLPAPLQQELVFTAAVASGSSEADAARAFINFLTSPAAAVVIQAKGMTPG